MVGFYPFLSFVVFCYRLQFRKVMMGTTMTVPVKISIQDLSIEEGSVDKNAFVRLQLNASSDGLITAHISSSDVSTTAGDDYTSFENVPIVFEPGKLIVGLSIANKRG